MYQALATVAEQSDPPTCGFVHLPYLPEQVAELIGRNRKTHEFELHQRADLASMSLDTMIHALRVVIESVLETGR